MDTVERVSCLKVPIDILPPDRMAERINELLATGDGHNIVLLSLRDLLKARKSGDYRSFVLRAAMVIPISKSIIGGVRFLTGKTAFRYMPFEFTVRLLTILEQRNRSVYLLGSKRRSLLTAERNLKHTFPGLRIVGRYVGGFHKHEEETILKAIRKASPSLLLVSKGVPGDEKWLAKLSSGLGPGLRMWCSDLFDVFAERRKRPSKASFDRGLEWIGFCFKNPLRIFRIFSYFRYKLLLLFYRIFKRS